MPEKSLDIVVKARNETRKGFNDVRKDLKSISGDFLKLVAGGAAIQVAFKAAAGSLMMMNASAREAAAIQKQSSADIINAQIEMSNAAAEIGRSLPLIGEAIGKAMLALSDVEGLRKTLELIKELESETKKYHETNLRMAKENEIAFAKMRGATESEIMRLRSVQREDETAAVIAEMEQKIADAREEARFRYAQANELQKRWDKWGIFGTGSFRNPALASGEAGNAAQNQAEALEEELAEFRRQTAMQTAIDEIEINKQKNEEIVNQEKERVDAQKAFLDEAHQLYLQSEADKTRAANERHAAERQREREELAALNDRADLENTLYAAVHSAAEVRARAINEKYDEMERKYNPLFGKADNDMLALIEQARRAELDSINKPASAGATTDVAAFSARFLTHAPGRTADPEWAKQLQAQSKEQTDALKNIENKLDATIGRMNWN